MDYDDHDYCSRCEKHSIDCYCFTGPAFAATSADDVCRTPEKCAPTAG